MKYYGKIGFAITEEVRLGVWEEVIKEKPYKGEFARLSKNQAQSSEPIDSIKLSQQVSIVADPFANDNFMNIRYLTYKKVKWAITDVQIEGRRLILTTGGIYNGK